MAGRVREMRMHTGVAGQRSIDALVVYDGGPVEEWYSFVGSVYGAPGPVVMVQPGNVQTFVYNPARFGDIFGSEWVLQFFEQ